MKIQIVVGSRDELAQRFVGHLDDAVRSAPPQRRFSLAVPGGSVAESFFPLLATAYLPWRSIDVFWVDERGVPPVDPQSNYALAERLWLEPAAVPSSNIHRMPADRPDLGRAAEEYAVELTAVAGVPPVLDYVLLGVGEDGHIASIFPGDPEGAADVAVAWTDRAPKPPARRMTLTMATIARARRVAIAAFGPSKQRVIAGALSDEQDRSPLARVLRATERPLLLTDMDPESIHPSP
jgi:6-phosphogluconolactonase